MERPEDKKSSHSEVGYEEKSKHEGATCSNCVHWIDAKQPRCESVESPIAPEAYCIRYSVDPEKLALAEYRVYREGDGKRPDWDEETAAYRASREGSYES